MRIVIIGGGACGVLTAAHLLENRMQRLEIVVVDPGERIGRGLAYATPEPSHLLNVRVDNMSGWADRPAHFADWLVRNGPLLGVAAPSPERYVPRAVYGAYLDDIADDALDDGRLTHWRGRCTDIGEQGDRVTVEIDGHHILEADHVVLATGNDAPAPSFPFPTRQPWRADTLAGLDRDAAVLIVGSGLTMVDMMLSLDSAGHRGRVTALSRHGLLPAPQPLVRPPAFALGDVPFGAPLSRLLRWVRDRIDAAIAETGDWRPGIDALRPHTQALWRSFDPEARRRFLRHLRARWDVHRHRMAPDVAARLAHWIAEGRLEVVAGRIGAVETTPAGLRVDLRRRGATATESRDVARILDCTGLAADPERSTNPLIRRLLAAGLARPDPLALGLDVADDLRLIDAAGRPSRRIRVIGPPARAQFWECIAIPDIRVQCRAFAAEIGDEAATPLTLRRVAPEVSHIA